MYGMLLELYNSEFAHIAKFLRHHGREGSKVFSKRCEKTMVVIWSFMADNNFNYRKEDGRENPKDLIVESRGQVSVGNDCQP